MRMRIGYTTDSTEILTKAICHVTGGPFSHTLPIFEESKGQPFYFESISKKDKKTGKTGLRGPYPIGNIRDWREEKPASRLFEITPYLPLTDAECREAYNLYCWGVHEIKYAYVQCLNNWIERRFRIYCHIGRRGHKRWNCSETVVRGMPSRLWKYFRLQDARADEIVPSGANLISVRECVKEMIQNEKAI